MISVKEARIIRDEAKNERIKYEELKAKVITLIVCAAHTEASSCKLEVPGTYPHKYHIERLVNELHANDFATNMCLTPEKYSIVISW